MQILSIEKTAWGGSGKFKDIAKFSVQINEDIRLVGLRLVEGPGGKRLVYAQSAGGGRCATFSLSMATALTHAANDAFEKIEDRKSYANHFAA